MALIDDSVAIRYEGLRDLAIIDHRIILHKAWIVEENKPAADLLDVNYFKDLDTDDDPDYSSHLMDVLIRFAIDFENANPENRAKIRRGVLLLHRASVTTVSALEGELPLSQLQAKLGNIAIAPE